ncbi:MAG: hypothetical protein EOL97_08995 [Spirochaetia bacterium]|nr:hypothetical protein [Spirochaetia bacterium]
MNAFFSNTDTKELEDNCEHYNYYLSLIVSFDRKYQCKIAIPAESEMTFTNKIKNTEGEFVTITTKMEKQTILVGDVTVESVTESNNIQWLSDRIVELKTAKPKVITYKNDSYTFNNKQANNKNIIKRQVTVYEFLGCVITLDTDNVHKSLISCIREVSDEFESDKLDLGIYSELLIENLEIIHKELEIFNDLDVMCKRTLPILKQNKHFFKSEELYNIIYHSLELYAK